MTAPAPIDFVALAAALLDRASTLVPLWLPAGTRKGNRWIVGDFDGADGQSANVDLTTGAWIDYAAPDEDKGGDLISLYARIRGLNNGQAARELMAMMGWERAAPKSAKPQSPAPAPAPSTRAARWRPVVPVPAHAPEPTFRWGYRDDKREQWIELDAVRTWLYEFEGERYGYVARYERVNSAGEIAKETCAWTWCEDAESPRRLQSWRTRQWDDPRPLYVPAGILSGEHRLPVVVVEGEKCAEAGHRLLGHEFDFVSWPGGCGAWAKARWGWIMGRDVILWPDCDARRERLSRAEREGGIDPSTKPVLPESKQAGMRAMVHIGGELVLKHGCTVSICRIPAPGSVGDGWDIADAIAQGWDADQVRAFIHGAVPFVPPGDEAKAALRGAAAEQSTPSMAPAREGGKASDDPSRAWRACLVETEKGAVKPIRENLVMALDGWPDRGIPGVPETAGLIVFNEFSNNVIKTRPTPWGTSDGPWEEADELLMGDWLLREYQLPSMARATLEEAVLMVARRHAVHPVREELQKLRGTWDRTDRLDTWLARCFIAADDPARGDGQFGQYLARAGKWFVMAMCARVLEPRKEGSRTVVGPGAKFDYMLILEGTQGWGKSTCAATLAGEYFADTGLNLGDKDSYQNIQGIWVYEWAELDSLARHEVSKVKMFISSAKDRFRATFDRRPRDYPRQVVFIGTTNETEYLADVTGNRRFWPVSISKPPDNAWLAANRDQLLAEAVQRVDDGERFWPTRDEQVELFGPQQERRAIQSSIEAEIRRYLYDPEFKVPLGAFNGSLVNQVGLPEVLTRIGYTVDKQTDAVVKRAGAVLRALGWKKRRLSTDGRPWVYVRPPNDSTHAAAGASPATDESRHDAGAFASEDDDDLPF